MRKPSARPVPVIVQVPRKTVLRRLEPTVKGGKKMPNIAKWPQSGVLDKEWEKLSKIVPEGVRIKMTKDPLRRNEIGVCCGSWHEYLTMMVLILNFQHEYRQLKKKVKRPGIARVLKGARKSYRDLQIAKPPKERPALMWK